MSIFGVIPAAEIVFVTSAETMNVRFQQNGGYEFQENVLIHGNVVVALTVQASAP